MASSHVPSDRLSISNSTPNPQGHSLYTDAAYNNLFPADRYASQSWQSSGQLGSSTVTPGAGQQTWHNNPYAPQSFTNLNQAYGSRPQDSRTASPYQYNQFASPNALAGHAHASNVDPSLGVDPNALRQQQPSPYPLNASNTASSAQTTTIAPQALQHGVPAQDNATSTSGFQIPRPTAELFAQRTVQPATVIRPISMPEYELPTSKKSGGFFLLDQVALSKATQSVALNKFVNIGSEPFHMSSNRTAVPAYVARQSIKELKRAGADNKRLLAKKASSKSPSAWVTIRSDASDSESYDESSSDDSDYSNDEEEVDVSPLPPARPEEMHGATRYDIIKATWFPRQSPPTSEQIKASLRDMWEVVNTIQKRWRLDSKAVSEAEEQKKTAELPVLKSRVASGRDLLQSALRSALEYAHPDVLYHVGQVKSFLYLCYQFLANRFKMQDYNGGLSSVIYEILARCVGTLTTELLDETKVVKALVSMKKHVNEQNKVLISQIIEGAAAGSAKTKPSTPPATDASTEPKGIKRPAVQPASRQNSHNPLTKKLKTTESPSGAEKKSGTVPTPSSVQTSLPTLARRPGEKVAPTAVKVRGTQVVNKPSNLFASLNAASKKPTVIAKPAAVVKPVAKPPAKPVVAIVKDKKATSSTAKPAFSFAKTMAELLKPKEKAAVVVPKAEKHNPLETSEDKAKRLRKEARRHLRVKFKPDANLVDIRYFSHDPEEESGHDANFVRDAGDIGGEGRMFKQHKEMMDDDDADDEVSDLRPWREPTQIDFSVIDADERKRNYEPYGGGESQPTCPEREANMLRERSTLLVFYSHPSDIPSSPREPLEQPSPPAAPASVTEFGTPPDLVLNRVPQAAAAPPVQDFSNLEALVKQFAVTQPTAPAQSEPLQNTYMPTPTVAAAPTNPTPDLASILSALGQPQAQAHVQPQAPISYAPAPAMSAAPAVDLQAIMAAIAPAANLNYSQPLPPGWPNFTSALQPNPSDSHDSIQMQLRGGQKRPLEDYTGMDRNNDTKKPWNSPAFNRPGGVRHKVLPCKFYSKGLCQKGEDCTYIHDLN